MFKSKKSNKEYFLKTCELYLSEYSFTSRDMLLKWARNMTNNTRDEFFDNTLDYELQAAKTFFSLTFDSISTGMFHLYRGVLTDVGEEMCRIFIKCLDTYKKKGIVTDEKYEEQISILIENINNVG